MSTQPSCEGRRPPWLLSLALSFLVLTGAAAGTGSAVAQEGGSGCPVAVGWTRLPAAEPPTQVEEREHRGALGVAAASGRPGFLYTGGFQGLHRTQNCGATWQTLEAPPPPPPLDLQPRRMGPSEVLAIGREGTLYVSAPPRGQMMISHDEGKTWQVAVFPIRGGEKAWSRGRFVAMSPMVEQLAYAEFRDLEGLQGMGTDRTLDGGVTWEYRTGFIGPLAVAPSYSDVVYLGFGGQLVRSIDGAATFDGMAGFDDIITALSMSPNGSHFWLATRSGASIAVWTGARAGSKSGTRPTRGISSASRPAPTTPPSSSEPPPADFPIPNGHFYTQANGRGGEGGTGFAVTDQEGIPFFSAFSSLPLQTVGYPISQRFIYRGFTTQLFQKLALQWQPERGVLFLNLMDELHEAGQDPRLLAHRSLPPPEDPSPDAGLPWDRVVARHQAILDRDPALRKAYLSEPRWLEVYGLPTGYGDFPEVSVVRGQRTALQRWKVDTPWARAGEITVANAGEMAREAGLFPVEALAPGPPP